MCGEKMSITQKREPRVNSQSKLQQLRVGLGLGAVYKIGAK